MRLPIILAALCLLAAAGPALAQDSYPVATGEFFAGKRVWVGSNWNPNGVIREVLPNGSFKVDVYRFNTNPNGTLPEEVFPQGNPTETVEVSAEEMTRMNGTRWTAWVSRNGTPWPKARVLSQTAREVQVEVWNTDGTAVEEVRTIPREEFDRLNRPTTPAPGESVNGVRMVFETDAEIRTALETINRGLPRAEQIPLVEEVVGRMREIVEARKPAIATEGDVHRRTQLQADLVRELYRYYQTMDRGAAPDAGFLRHPGRHTSTAEFKAQASERVSRLPASARGSVQELLTSRMAACFSQAALFWGLVNASGVQEAGVGARVLNGNMHGVMYVELADGSRYVVELTEGFEPHGPRALKRMEVFAQGGRTGIGYLDSMTPADGTPARVQGFSATRGTTRSLQTLQSLLGSLKRRGRARQSNGGWRSRARTRAGGSGMLSRVRGGSTLDRASRRGTARSEGRVRGR